MSENNIYNGTYVLGDTSATVISAGPGIKIDDSVPGVIKVSNDETVLFDSHGSSAYTSAQLSESPLNFERTKFYMHDDGGTCWGVGEFLSEYASGYNTIQCGYTTPWNTTGMRCIVAKNMDNTYLKWYTDGYQWWGNGGGQIGSGYMRLYKVVGVNRISGGN